ncbi:P-loop containing nucleoside triphosphate hydrolase protein, partial [Armillaria fumosa]
QVEVVRQSHLVWSLHDESDEAITSSVTDHFLLNPEQERAFRIVAEHLGIPAAEQLRMYIGGMAGTGKTRVLNALIEYFVRQGESYRLVVVAPTGTAASIINGSTYHFMFGINEASKDSMSKKAMAEVKECLRGVDYIFLDEVSMLSCADLYRISSRLSVILNVPDMPFGG